MHLTMSKPYKKILILENEMEAQRLSSILEEEGIPHMVRSYHDSVYDGIFQSQRGWGHLEAPEEYEDTINLLYNNMRGE
jgi:outer membrane protein assembly factor BamE (lipoprotein component of BamABCDE complex)